MINRACFIGLLVGTALAGVAPIAAPAPVSQASAQQADVVARGQELIRMGRWDRALLVLRNGLPQRESDSELQRALSRAYSEIGEDAPAGSRAQKANFERALAHAKRSLELDPRSAQSHLDVAITTGKIARVSGAKRKLKLAPIVRDEATRALELDPSLWTAHHVLGVWHREIATLGGFKRFGASLLGDVPDASLEEAISHLEQARSLAPRSIRNELELGRTYVAAGQDEKARAELKTALALPPTEPRDSAMLREARRELEAIES
jgi:tetratricopeptide (TPR) repeat protein